MTIKQTSKTFLSVMALTAALLTGYSNQKLVAKERVNTSKEMEEAKSLFSKGLYAGDTKHTDKFHAIINSLKKKPENLNSLILLAKANYGLGDYETALSYANKAVVSNDSNQEAYFIRGQINLRKPDWISALNDFRKILELNPNSIDAQTMLGYMESGSGNYKTAIDRFTKTLEMDPNNSNLYAYRGHSNYLLKDYQKSINDITKALEIESKSDQKGDIANFARTRLIDPSIPVAVLYTTLCSSYSNLGDHSNAALQACTKAIEIDPEPFTYLASAKIKMSQGDFGGSCSDYKKAISIGYQPITLKERGRKVLLDGICLFK